jgi:Kef-type K+ transport system membrane component KefB
MELLLILLVILVLARLAGAFTERIGQTAILGELLAGVVLGVVVTAFPNILPQFVDIGENEVFKAICNLGIFFLMFMAGMEMRLEQLAGASKRGSVIALGGLLLPLALGYGLGWLWLPGSEYKFEQAFFLGVALSVTSTAISIRILMDVGQLRTKLGHTIISAAVIDDIIGLGLLAILVSILEIGSMPSGLELAILAVKILGFFVFAIIVGRFMIPRIGTRLRSVKTAEVEFSIALAIALIFAVAAEALGMHFIIGAFIAGLLIRERTFGDSAISDIQQRVSGISLGFLAPIFFASVGLQLDLSALSTALPFTVVLILVAIAGKLIGCGLPARLLKFSNRESLAIGSVMNGRGEVLLIAAAIALAAELFENPVPTPPIVTALFSSVVITAIVTTILTPFALKLFLKPESKE